MLTFEKKIGHLYELSCCIVWIPHGYIASVGTKLAEIQQNLVVFVIHPCRHPFPWLSDNTKTNNNARHSNQCTWRWNLFLQHKFCHEVKWVVFVKFAPNVERSGVDSCERQGPLLPTPDLEHQLHQGLKECEEPLTGLMTDLFR